MYKETQRLLEHWLENTTDFEQVLAEIERSHPHAYREFLEIAGKEPLQLDEQTRRILVRLYLIGEEATTVSKKISQLLDT
jgi:hypothetical protein